MNNPAVFIGLPLFFKNRLAIYPPKVVEVVGNVAFSQYLKILTITQEDITDDFMGDNKDATPPSCMEFLLINCYHNSQFEELAKEAFNFFLHQPVDFLYQEKMIRVGGTENEFFTIGEDDYFDFQNAIREACGDNPVTKPEPINPNEDPRVRAIKEKARQRDRIKAKQQAKNGISLLTCLNAICCMGIGITPLNIGEMSYAAIGPIMKMMQEKERYDIDIRSLLAGADSKKIKPKYWIRNTDKD